MLSISRQFHCGRSCGCVNSLAFETRPVRAGGRGRRRGAGRGRRDAGARAWAVAGGVEDDDDVEAEEDEAMEEEGADAEDEPEEDEPGPNMMPSGLDGEGRLRWRALHFQGHLPACPSYPT